MTGISMRAMQLHVFPSDKGRPSFKGWAAIAAAVIGVVLFLFVFGPMGLESSAYKPIADFIEENNINANAYYYTEVDEFFDAERHMRDHLKLVPGADPSSP